MKKRKILIVDDNQDIRELFDIFLGQEYDVSKAEDGLKAIEFLTRESFDAIVTDYNMPRMNGLELAEAVKVKWPQIPMLMMSSDTSCSEKLFENNIKLFLPKPSSPMQIESGLKYILGLNSQSIDGSNC